MKKYAVLSVLTGLSLFAFAAPPQGRDAFLREQAFAEMQRVSSQVDTLQANFDDLQRRVAKLERGNDTRALQAEIDGLKATIADLRRELAAQRGEIIRELAKKIVSVQPKDPPTPPPSQRRPVVTGPTATYTVESGDSLYLIAKAFNTTVPKLREMNGLKKDSLKVGQKLIVPQN